MVFYNTNTDPNKVFIAGIGIGDKPVSLPIIPGISGLEQISINPYNKDQTGVQLATSVVTSYTKTSIFDGTAEGHLTLSDYYAFRLNFIPINETTSTDDKFNLKVLVRNYPIVAGDSATWSDITGSVSRSFDLTKDILIPNGLDIFDSADTMKGWQIANQDLIFIKKTLLDIPNLTDQGVMPRCIVIRGGSQLSTISDDFTSDIDLNSIFYNIGENISINNNLIYKINENSYEKPYTINDSEFIKLHTVIPKGINTWQSGFIGWFNIIARNETTKLENQNSIVASASGPELGTLESRTQFEYCYKTFNNVFDRTGYSSIESLTYCNSNTIVNMQLWGDSTTSVIVQRESLKWKDSESRNSDIKIRFRMFYNNLLLTDLFYYRFGDISGIPSPATIRKAPMIPTKARQYKIDLTTKEYTRDESTNSIYGYKNGVSLQDQLDEEKNKVVTLDESNEIATLEIQENITINKKGIDKKKKK